jgi:myo-inositol 2-dehydrogenase/D-chiro-inositol 1-dehydrogenase
MPLPGRAKHFLRKPWISRTVSAIVASRWLALCRCLHDHLQPAASIKLRLRHARIQAGDRQCRARRSLSRDPAPPPISYVKTSGGIFRIYDDPLTLRHEARFLMGARPVQVFATGSALVKIGAAGDVDAAVISPRLVAKICQIPNSRRASCSYDQQIGCMARPGLLRAKRSGRHGRSQCSPGFRRAPTMNFS